MHSYTARPKEVLKSDSYSVAINILFRYVALEGEHSYQTGNTYYNECS